MAYLENHNLCFFYLFAFDFVHAMVEVIINFEICFLGPKGPPGDAGANGKLTSWFAFTLVSVHSQLVKYISIIKTRQNCYYILPHCLHC